MLIINADDLGRTKETTDCTLTCYNKRRIHAASLMTFMEDSERAAELSSDNNLPVGLHLNLTLNFTGGNVKSQLRLQHNRVTNYLNARKFNQVFYNPVLRSAFEYVYKSQWDEFHRIYGEYPERLDGHHHMHLCMNMILSGLYRGGLKIRRHFSYYTGEKNSLFKRLYRNIVDRWLGSKFRCTNFFFCIEPIEQERLKRFILLSTKSDVEIVVHPGMESDYLFLLSPEWERLKSGTGFTDQSVFDV